MPIPTASFNDKRVRIAQSDHPAAVDVVGIARHNGWYGGSGPLSPNQDPVTLLREAHYTVEPEDERDESRVANLVFGEFQLIEAD